MDQDLSVAGGGREKKMDWALPGIWQGLAANQWKDIPSIHTASTLSTH